MSVYNWYIPHSIEAGHHYITYEHILAWLLLKMSCSPGTHTHTHTGYQNFCLSSLMIQKDFQSPLHELHYSNNLTIQLYTYVRMACVYL